jgi:hypothetical protein
VSSEADKTLMCDIFAGIATGNGAAAGAPLDVSAKPGLPPGGGLPMGVEDAVVAGHGRT